MKIYGMTALCAAAACFSAISLNVASAQTWRISLDNGPKLYAFDRAGLAGSETLGLGQGRAQRPTLSHAPGRFPEGGLKGPVLRRIFGKADPKAEFDFAAPGKNGRFAKGGNFGGVFRKNPKLGAFDRIFEDVADAQIGETPKAVTWDDFGLNREPNKRLKRIIKNFEFGEDGEIKVREVTDDMTKREKRWIRRADRWLKNWRAKQDATPTPTPEPTPEPTPVEPPVEQTGRAQVFQSWMHEDVQAAWNAGYAGQGTSIIIVDDFSSGSIFGGDLGDGSDTLHHGDWVTKNAGMIATEASLQEQGWYDYSLNLAATGLNVANASYGVYSTNKDASNSGVTGGLIDAAHGGTAVVVKAAGNNAVAVDAANYYGQWDTLNMGLIGSQSGLFVGALSTNGAVDKKASLAGYSNFAGGNAEVQDRFLVVGVDSNITGLAGTSFAAPTVSGYAAVLGSKFTDASAIEVSNQLLDTARTDTILNYDVSVHGQGEASLSRALAPISIQ